MEKIYEDIKQTISPFVLVVMVVGGAIVLTGIIQWVIWLLSK